MPAWQAVLWRFDQCVSLLIRDILLCLRGEKGHARVEVRDVLPGLISNVDASSSAVTKRPSAVHLFKHQLMLLLVCLKHGLQAQNRKTVRTSKNEELCIKFLKRIESSQEMSGSGEGWVEEPIQSIHGRFSSKHVACSTRR